MMDLRLAYRIATMKPSPPHPDNISWPIAPGGLDARMRMEAKAVAGCPKFVFDNVARFYAEHSRQEWDNSEDIPNWAPPFGRFFVEWNEPAVWNLPEGHPARPVRDCQHGIHALVLNVTEENRHRLDEWRLLFGNMAGYPGPVTDSRMIDPLEQSRWVIWTSFWTTYNAKPLFGAPLWLGLYAYLFVTGSGRIVTWNAIGPTVDVFASQDGRAGLSSLLHVFGLGLSFMHCKNVRQVDAVDHRGDRFHRDKKVPAFTFRTLEIDPMREVLRREGRSDEVGIQKALHICRGHFATYSEERPLFGRHVGTFWKPDHVRGNAARGVVEKEYTVAAPEGTP